MAGRAEVHTDWAPVARRIRDEATDNWDDTVAADRFTGLGKRARRVLTARSHADDDNVDFSLAVHHFASPGASARRLRVRQRGMSVAASRLLKTIR